MDNDGDFFIGILEGNLFCCRLRACGVSMTTFQLHYQVSIDVLSMLPRKFQIQFLEIEFPIDGRK